MKKRSIWLLSILLILPSTATGTTGSGIAFDREVYDFGAVPYGAIVVGEFAVKNVGEQTLIIKDVQADCGCTNTIMGAKELSRGQESRIVAKFDTAGLRPGKKMKHIHVRSNDPARPEVELTLLADVVRELNVDETTFARKLEKFSAEHAFEVNVSNSSKVTRRITGIRVREADCKVTMENADLTIPPGKRLPFSVALTLSEGGRSFYMGKVILETDHPVEKEIEIKYLIQFAKPN